MWQISEIGKARVSLLHDLCLSSKWEFKVKGNSTSIWEFLLNCCFSQMVCEISSGLKIFHAAQYQCNLKWDVYRFELFHSLERSVFINPALVIGLVVCELTLWKIAVRYSCYTKFVLLWTSADTCPVKYFNYFIIGLWVKWKLFWLFSPPLEILYAVWH